MITVRRYHDGQADDHEDPDEISDLVGRETNLLWVDVADPTEADFDRIQEEFCLHPLAIEDARHQGQRPKLELYESHAFIVAYSGDICPVNMFVGPCWVVTFRAHNPGGKEWPLAEARDRFERIAGTNPRVGQIVWSVLDTLVDDYLDTTDAIEDEIETLEERIFGERLTEERAMQSNLFDIRRRLVELRRRVNPMREVVSPLLRREVPWIDMDDLAQFQDLFDHVLRAVDLIDSQRELMGNAVDAHLAIISNNMNRVMKTMTGWGSLLIGSTLIAGIYGMNFDHMPELHWLIGYPLALGMMLVLTLVGRAALKRRDWL